MYRNKRIKIDETKYLIDDISRVNTSFSTLQSSIVRFVCYFNLFECFLHRNRIYEWYKFQDKFIIKEEYLENIYKFFKERYVEYGETNEEFDDLCKYVDGRYKNKLKNELQQDENKPHALLSISYYFRNNLYHGHKKICSLKKYEECFYKIANILQTIIENAELKTQGEN